MNWKERIINTIQGKPVDFLAFVPRLDTWYQSNKLNNRLPEKYKNCTLREIIKDFRSVFNGKITIWGGLPSIGVLEESMSDYEFDKFLDYFFNYIEKGDRLILSFADTTPPIAKLERIEKAARMARSFKI